MGMAERYLKLTEVRKMEDEPSLIYYMSYADELRLSQLKNLRNIKLLGYSKVEDEDFSASHVQFVDHRGNSWNLLVPKKYKKTPGSRQLIDDIQELRADWALGAQGLG